MKFKFKIQQYQTEAVEQTVNVFAGQPSKTNVQYRRDLGKTDGRIVYEEEYVGWRNNDVELQGHQLLSNIQQQQTIGNIPKSAKLIMPTGLGACALDIEMETGTGKTYVYIKTMFELNRLYGWSKFIVVVPSIAIREGVNKSFQMLEDHFMQTYQKKARYFIYNSNSLSDLDDFSSSASIQVMIINTQAFARDFKEDAKNKVSLIMYTKRDEFASRRPIDVIAANRPIIIMDEPQKMEGAATQKALKNFKPLFVLNYSATHKTSHNCVYALDALDAYRQRLVKKIQVKGITIQNLLGNQSYIYFDSIILSKNKAPEVRLEIEVKGASSTRRQLCKFKQNDSLYDASELSAYKGFVITDIDPLTNTVRFQNGDSLRKGDVMGDISEQQIQQIQIRETIRSHFEKEEQLFRQGIKTLSLFFIDEVANYKGYDEEGEVVHGPLWKIFEKEYTDFLNENLSLFDSDYQKYLRDYPVESVHSGYFSIDKKSGRAVNSEVKRGESYSSDIDAYNLILRNKEALLNMKGETGGVRFIFSHSALREGWDNPNVFQICTLRHANSTTAKRQEVGRGLRICVDSQGNRMDAERLGDAVHDINQLTVIANESYSTFVESLQNDTREALRERPKQATPAYFEGRKFKVGEELHEISAMEASAIVNYLFENDYVDEKGNILPSYHEDLQNGALAPMSKKLQPISEQVHKLVQGIFDPSALEGMIDDGNGSATVVNDRLNKNAEMEQFKKLWEQINHRYVYTVHYDSEELIRKCIAYIDKNLRVTQLKYVVTTGEQGQDEVEFTGQQTTRTQQMRDVSTSQVPYDLVGEIAKGATLTRRTVVRILQGINRQQLYLFRNNPEEFIRNVVRLIKDQKATMIVEHISYNKTENKYETSIFTEGKNRQPIEKAYKADKHILDYVFTDSKGERKFAKDLDDADEVCVYARLPRTFKIPTPVGGYAPDWAVAFYDNMGVKHIFFIAETKGSLLSMDLKGAELTKIECAKKLFNEISTDKVRYHEVTDYQNMLDEINSLK